MKGGFIVLRHHLYVFDPVAPDPSKTNSEIQTCTHRSGVDDSYTHLASSGLRLAYVHIASSGPIGLLPIALYYA